MHVLHVIPSVSPVHGGPSRAIAILEKALSANGVMITTATTDDDGASRRLRPGERPPMANGAIRFYARKWLEFYKLSPGLILWIWTHLQQFEIVHIHALFSFPSIVAGLIAWIRKKPFIIRPLGTLNTYGVTKKRPWLKKLSLALIEGPLLRHASAVHFTSVAEMDQAADLGIQCRGVVVPLGVEHPGHGDRQAFFDDHHDLEGRRIILFMSRIDPVKNVEALLKAFSNVDNPKLNTALVIAGDGPSDYVNSLKELAKSLGIDQQVTWLGFVSGQHKADILAAADVYVLPSLSESFGIAAVEAMLSGLPCLLGEGVAIAREVVSANAGLAVSPDSDSILQALEAILSNDTRRVTMGICGRRFAEDNYSCQTMASKLTLLYQHILNESVASIR